MELLVYGLGGYDCDDYSQLAQLSPVYGQIPTSCTR